MTNREEKVTKKKKGLFPVNTSRCKKKKKKKKGRVHECCDRGVVWGLGAYGVAWVVSVFGQGIVGQTMVEGVARGVGCWQWF